MKKLILAVIGMIVVVAKASFAADLGNTRWNQANIDTLRSFDKTAIFEFLSNGSSDPSFTENNILEFGWYDLAGDGNYELVWTGSSGPCCVWLTIVSRDRAVTANDQNLRDAGKLADTVRDLDGDGKMELILWQELAKPSTWLPAASTPKWPAVYRLQRGKYVEDSRDFPKYYDSEILPRIEQQIAEFRAKSASRPSVKGYQSSVAIATLEKNKILRVLGREPAAGLRQAYEWMNSDNPQILQCAIATFWDIGGYKKEMHDAEQAFRAALKRSPKG